MPTVLNHFSAGSSYIYIGAHDLFTIEEDRMVLYSETFVEHPNYKPEQISNDVALIKLPKKVVYTGKVLQLIAKIQLLFVNYSTSLVKYYSSLVKYNSCLLKYSSSLVNYYIFLVRYTSSLVNYYWPLVKCP